MIEFNGSLRILLYIQFKTDELKIYIIINNTFKTLNECLSFSFNVYQIGITNYAWFIKNQSQWQARLLESDLIDTFKNAKNGMDVPVNGFCRIISILISG